MNLLTLRNLTGVDSGMQPILAQVPTGDKINNSDVGDGRNTGGYRFNQRNNELLDNVTGKLDYNITHAPRRERILSRTIATTPTGPTASNNYGLVPAVTDPTHADLVALSWRWTPTATLTNEVRGGFNLTYGYFLNAQGNVSNIVIPPTPSGRPTRCSPIRSTSFKRRAALRIPTTCPTTRRGSMDATTFSSASTSSTSA